MAAISSHLHVKPFQVAVSRDKNLEARKWDHKGTIWAVSLLQAAYLQRGDKPGDAIDYHPVQGGVGALEFPDGEFVRVGFGTTV